MPDLVLVAVAVIIAIAITLTACASPGQTPRHTGDRGFTVDHPPLGAYRALLDFMHCMRSHGMPGFPDPTVAQGGTAVGFKLGNTDQSSPQFQAAARACRNFEPGMAGMMTGGGTP